MILISRANVIRVHVQRKEYNKNVYTEPYVLQVIIYYLIDTKLIIKLKLDIIINQFLDAYNNNYNTYVLYTVLVTLLLKTHYETYVVPILLVYTRTLL